MSVNPNRATNFNLGSQLSSTQLTNSALSEISALITLFQSQAQGRDAAALSLGIVLGWLRILRLGRLRLRGPSGDRDEFLLAATVQNLRKLAKLVPTVSACRLALVPATSRARTQFDVVRGVVGTCTFRR